MERKKPAPPPSSSSDEGSSTEEEESEQGFVRSDRKTAKIEAKKAQNPVAAEEEDSDEDEEEEEEEDAHQDGGFVDGTQRGMARDNREAPSSSDTTQAGHGHGDSNSGSETSSASKGKPGKPSHQFVVIPRKAENANGHGKKTPTSEKPPKVRPTPETSPKKTKDKASKRDRDAEPQEKGSSKKQKKESSSKPSKTDKVSKEKSTPSHTSEKKTDVKKSSHAAAVSEDPKIAPAQQNSVKNLENASAKKAAEKSRNDKKATTKDAEPDPLKGSFSPSKPKLFTPKEELVLSTEILHDVKQGVELPVKKVHGYWDNLFDRVKGRMEGSVSKERLCDKVKRMKTRYTTMAGKFKDSAECKFRNSSDKELFGLWDQIWGSGDGMDVDREREDSDVKDKQPKVSSPVKVGKAPRNKGVTAIKDIKMVHEESEGPKSKQTEKKESSDDDDDDDDDDGDDSGSEESNGEGDLNRKPTARMDEDRKDAPADRALIPKGNAVQVHENTAPSHSTSDAKKLFQEEVRATLSELEESSKKALKEWQSKALVVVENAVRAAADQSRLSSGAGVAGFDGLSNPLRRLDLLDSHMVEGDQALQQQWQELRLRELDVYRQKLELMQKECQLKQDQLKLQLGRNK